MTGIKGGGDRKGRRVPPTALVLLSIFSVQLGAAIASLRSLGIHDLPCVGLAKENEEIYSGSQEPLMLPRSSAGLKMLQHARDEAHRFGLAYNVSLRKFR